MILFDIVEVSGRFKDQPASLLIPMYPAIMALFKLLYILKVLLILKNLNLFLLCDIFYSKTILWITINRRVWNKTLHSTGKTNNIKSDTSYDWKKLTFITLKNYNLLPYTFVGIFSTVFFSNANIRYKWTQQFTSPRRNRFCKSNI